METSDTAQEAALAVPLADRAATGALAAALAHLLRRGDALLLEGPLGAGKTTLARALLRAACGDPALEVPSPSYTLVQEYESPMGTITHFDLWRIDPADSEAAAAAVEEIGWHDARAGIVLVEWPDRLHRLRPADALTIAIVPADEETDDGARLATLSGWAADRLAPLRRAPERAA